MTSLIHYGTEKVEINGRSYLWDDFMKVVSDYSVPYGWKTRVYRRGECHYISDGSNSLKLPIISEECDGVCNKEGELARLVLRLKQELED